jgi:hypothetical protein
MSSHHIVREDQEPVLLILDGNSIPLSFVEQLLEWSPTVIATEASIDKVLSWGIKIDIVIVSEAYLSTDELLSQTPISVIRFNDNPLQAALTFIIQKKYTALNILAEGITDLDFIMSSAINIDIVAFINKARYSLIRVGIFEKWLLQGTQLQIYPNLKIITKGLNEKLEVVNTGFVRIEASELFWVGELLVQDTLD